MIDEGEPFLTSPRELRAMIAPYPGCAECDRLVEQGRAALLCGDRSRLTDVRVLQQRHNATEHSAAEPSPAAARACFHRTHSSSSHSWQVADPVREAIRQKGTCQ